MAKGKKYTDALKRFDREQLFTPVEALGLVKSLASATFDETVEVAVRLGVDPRKADQMVRGTVALPAGTGKDVRVAVFAQGEAAQQARDAGADMVGADDLADEIQKGNLNFDVAIATPDLMPMVGRLGRVLGPRGLMPNPKTGTVTQDVARAVTEFKGGKVEYRTDRYGNVHVPIGKTSFTPEALEQNLRALLDELQRAKPASAKGRYLRKISLASTMGPGVKIDTARLRPADVPPDRTGLTARSTTWPGGRSPSAAGTISNSTTSHGCSPKTVGPSARMGNGPQRRSRQPRRTPREALSLLVVFACIRSEHPE